jgi:hypothetical protein
MCVDIEDHVDDERMTFVALVLVDAVSPASGEPDKGDPICHPRRAPR